MTTLVKKFAHACLDLIAPRRCTCCGAFDSWLCDACAAHLRHDGVHVCHACKKTPTTYGELCTHCRGSVPLRSICIATDSDSALIHTLVHRYKYQFIDELAAPLAQTLVRSAQSSDLPIPDVVMPVPLHRRRLRWRGFNQSALLAQRVADTLLPSMLTPYRDDLLVRTRYTTPQVERGSRSARLNNLKNAFAVAGPDAVRGKRILIIDDIATTGTTLVECAQALKAAGAKSVDALVLSRG